MNSPSDASLLAWLRLQQPPSSLAACAACDICVDVTRDMGAVTTADLAAEYAPYDAARPALAGLPVGPEVHGGERPGEGARGR